VQARNSPSPPFPLYFFSFFFQAHPGHVGHPCARGGCPPFPFRQRFGLGILDFASSPLFTRLYWAQSSDAWRVLLIISPTDPVNFFVVGQSMVQSLSSNIFFLFFHLKAVVAFFRLLFFSVLSPSSRPHLLSPICPFSGLSIPVVLFFFSNFLPWCQLVSLFRPRAYGVVQISVGLSRRPSSTHASILCPVLGSLLFFDLNCYVSCGIFLIYSDKRGSWMG